MKTSILLGSILLMTLGGINSSAAAQSADDAVAGLAKAGELLARDVQFIVKADQGRMKISWTILAEGGIASYEIYRTSSDNSLSKVCTFKSVQHNGKTSYTFFDFAPLPGASHYQLALVDTQGNRVMLHKLPAFTATTAITASR